MPTQKEKRRIPDALFIPGVLLVIIWAVNIIAWITATNFGWLGILPRSIEGLIGILTSPFIHGGWDHLVSNSAPFFILMAAIMYFYKPIAPKVIAVSWIMTGSMVWMFAAKNYHIGASGVVYAFAGFLFFSGVFRRDIQGMIISLLVVFMYGGLVWGVLPVQPGVSWESHLFGGVAGTAIAWWQRKNALAPKKKYSWDNEPEEQGDEESEYWNYKGEADESLKEFYRKLEEKD